MISINDDGALSLAGSGFAIEFWVQWDELEDSVDASLLNKDNYQIKWTAADGIKATVGVNGPVTISSLPGLARDAAHHVVLTWRGAGGNLTLYVDNQVEDWAILDNPDGSSDALEIGEGFVGLIDEVALYGRAFDADDVDFHWKTSAGGKDYCYSAGAGDVSSATAEFTLAGCALPEGGSITAGSCSRNGAYYCGEQSLILYDTFYDDTGCSLEQGSYTAGTTQCCPSGYLCSDDPDTPGAELVCNLRIEDCAIHDGDKDACAKAGCFWIDVDGGVCVDNPSDYSCSIYQSETSCELDVWNVGAAGMGTEVCGTYFVVSQQGYVIPQDSCECDWTGAECVLGYDVKPDIYGGVADTFRCQKDFTSGDCIDGLQKITWSAEGIIDTGWASGISSEVLAAAGCVTDAVGIDRDCGAPIIRVPGFSLFSLIASVGIVTLIYAFKQKHKD
jgi:hypothetical protein